MLQEILHRYVAIDRRDAIQPAFDALLGVVDEVLAVDSKNSRACKTDCSGVSTSVARDISCAIELLAQMMYLGRAGFQAQPGAATAPRSGRGHPVRKGDRRDYG